MIDGIDVTRVREIVQTFLEDLKHGGPIFDSRVWTDEEGQIWAEVPAWWFPDGIPDGCVPRKFTP